MRRAANDPKPSEVADGRLASEKPIAPFDRRWAYFFITELNGLVDQRRLALEQQEAPKVAATEARMRQVLRSLSWSPEIALRSAYEFARDRLEYSGDVWGPALVIAALGGTAFIGWTEGLPRDCQQSLTQIGAVLACIGPIDVGNDGQVGDQR